MDAAASAFGDSCPCGGARYDACCGALHRGARQAATAEELMRSRYAAYAVGEPAHLFRTWHPRTRPRDVTTDRGLRWTGLRILDTVAGGAADATGVVEFEATFDAATGPGRVHERSAFSRRASRWVYDGPVED